MRDRKHEKTKGYKESTTTDHLARVTSIQEPPDHVRQQKHNKGLSRADQVQFKLISTSE
jgi:hypothetical protein